MLWAMLPTSLLEALLNQLLLLDPQSQSRLQKLTGKRLRVTLDDFSQALTVTVGDRGLWLSWLDHEAVDCAIRTRLAVLPELREAANITRLIKADLLDIEGDPMLAQALSKLFAELDIDWPEQLSQRLGDVPAQLIVQAWQRSQQWLQQQTQDQRQWLRDALIEEQQLLPSAAEFSLFRTDVQALRARIDRLERQLSGWTS
jgi:ubiquinone biosynthesis protein UbiJ